MKRRWIFLGLAIGLVLVLTVGFFLASGDSTRVAAAVGRSTLANVITPSRSDADAMHDSPRMPARHAQMPAEWQQRCDAMHEQMEQWMESGQMGSGMMGSGMMGSGYSSANGPGYGVSKMSSGEMMVREVERGQRPTDHLGSSVDDGPRWRQGRSSGGPSKRVVSPSNSGC